MRELTDWIAREYRARVLLDGASNQTSKPVWASAVSLPEATDFGADGEEMKPRWLQVSKAGTYKGYQRGEAPFTFTREHFEQAVKNLHAHPRFKADPVTREGTEDIIRWDFEHVSEITWARPQLGHPSEGWSRDLKVVTGSDGVAELWALTHFLEPALGYVRKKKYRDASIALDFHFVDPVSGKDVGAVVTSIALTNDPFVQGMQPLAAKRGGPESVEAGLGYFSPAGSAQEALDSLRQLFGLSPTQGISELFLELEKVRDWASTGTAPLGVDLEEIGRCMRTILGLPALNALPEVLDNARQIVQRLLEESGPAGPAPQGAMMDLKKLAAMLGVRETDDAVLAAITELLELRAGIVKATGRSERDGVRVLLEATAEISEGGAEHKALLKALGAEDLDAGVERIALLSKDSTELAALKPEHEKLKKKLDEQEAQSVEADVVAAMAGHSIDETLKDALVLLRKSIGSEKFLEKYPAKKPEQKTTAAKPGANKQALLSVVAAGGSKLEQPGEGDEGKVNLALYPGRNKTEKAMSYLSGKVSGWDKMSREQQIKAASRLMADPNVVFEQQQAS